VMIASFCILVVLMACVEARLRSPMVNKHRRLQLEKWATPNKAIKGPPKQWFTQTLDHFNAQDSRTWQQRYYVNDSFYNAGTGGPIFLQIGGEGAIGSYYVTELEFVVYAQEMNALVVALEHRFYGESHPLPDMATSNLVYLSSQQALADAAVFVTFLKQQYSTATDVISFGGSYPGALAAWFRDKFPSSTAASIATSAPVLAVLDMVSYLEVVDRSLASLGGAQCDTNVRAATAQLDSMLQTAAGAKQVSGDFQTCTPLTSFNSLDTANFLSDVIGNFMGVVQYDAEIPGQPTIQDLCAAMASPNGTAYENFVTIADQFLEQSGQSCLDVSYKDMIAQLTNLTSWGEQGVGMRQWTYQTCAEFGYFQTTDSPNQPFGDGVPLQFYLDICSNVFGMSQPPRINFTNTFYGGATPYGATHIVFVNGNVDPWSSLSVLKDLSPSLIAVEIDGGAHCSNMTPWRKGMNPNIRIAQTRIAKLIQKFLSEGPLKK